MPNIDFVDSERVFLISGELEFHVGLRGGQAALVWKDLAGGIGEACEFVVTGSSRATTELFVQGVYRAMYERKYRKSSENASPKDLLAFVTKYVSNNIW